MTFSAFSFRLPICRSSFARLLDNFDVIFINSCSQLRRQSSRRRYCQRFRSFGRRLKLTCYTQIINQNTLNRFIRDVEIIYYLSDAYLTTFKHCFYSFFDVIVINRDRFSMISRCQ